MLLQMRHLGLQTTSCSVVLLADLMPRKLLLPLQVRYLGLQTTSWDSADLMLLLLLQLRHLGLQTTS
jgi:hypothetical protein